MPLPPPAGPILEQHRGAGSSSDQTTREGQAGVSCIPRGAANDPRLRGHALDPEGASEVGERFGCSATDSVHQQLVRGGGMRRSPANLTNRSLAAFGKLQHIRFGCPAWRVHGWLEPSILGVDQLAFRQLEQYLLEHYAPVRRSTTPRRSRCATSRPAPVNNGSRPTSRRISTGSRADSAGQFLSEDGDTTGSSATAIFPGEATTFRQKSRVPGLFALVSDLQRWRTCPVH